MISTRQQKKLLACIGKVKHQRDAAIAEALRLSTHNKLVHAYRCPYCKAWHCGRKPIEIKTTNND